MYVIFPADEIILLSYGIAQNPRLYQSRPTLDRLREPTVPQSTIGTRPPPSPSTPITTTTTTNSLTPNHHVRSPSIKQQRDPSPSRVSFADDFMNKSRTSIVDESTYSRTAADLNSFNSSALPASSSEAAKKKNNKLKSKITKISLGKLGSKISASNEQLEAASSTRVTEDHHLRIHNPTFTHDNLRQKNFDAFFASGEPVYSFERKEGSLLTPQSYTDSFSSSYAPSPITPITPPSFASLPPPSSHHRESSVGPLASALKSNTSKSSSTNSSSGGGNNKRPKSAELYRSSAENSSVKGDRCPTIFFDDFFFFF